VTITLKNVPKALADQLKSRAKVNHRSMQGEAMHILEGALVPVRKVGIAEIYERIRKRGVRTPSNSVRIIRELRDGRLSR
jgi:plasmid stability protein